MAKTARNRTRSRTLVTPMTVDSLVLRLIGRQCFARLERTIRDCARSLRVPANTLFIESLNRVHEQMARQAAADPAVLAVLGEPHAAARAVGFPRWDGDPQAALVEVIAAVREAGRSLPPVH
jgi:hypothetical protein